MSYLIIYFLSFSFADSNIEQCLKNPAAYKIGLKSALNSYYDADSQRLDDLKWPEYCDCYVKYFESVPKTKGNLPKEEYLKLAQQNEVKSIECVKKAGFNLPKPQPSYPPLVQNPFFDEKIKFCGSNGIGRTIIIESELSATKDPRKEKVRSMNLPNFCKCYYEQLRHRLGDEKAKLMANFDTHKAKPEEMLDMNQQDRLVTEYCVGQQIPYPKNKEDTTINKVVNIIKSPVIPAVPKKPEPEITPFDKIIKTQFNIAEGIGDIKIGTSTEKLNQLMGPIGVKTARNEFDEYRYGKNLTELIVRTAPPGNIGKVIYVKVDYTFRGPISKGLKMGETFESVIEKMKPWVPYSTDRHIGHLMYKEGAQFSFSDYGGGILQGLIAFDPATHPMLKKQNK